MEEVQEPLSGRTVLSYNDQESRVPEEHGQPVDRKDCTRII